MFADTLGELLTASLETLYMVFASGFLACLIGTPLGMLLFSNKAIQPKPWLNKISNSIINILRSIPFIILLVLLIPVTRFLTGSSIGSTATIVPLTIGAIPFVARLVENIYSELPMGLIEAGIAMGASARQIILTILLPDALPALINAFTVTIITLVAYSAMAGAVGGGGLGDLAIRYGYQRFDLTILISTIIILVIMVQAFQFIGDKLAKYTSH